MSETTARAKLEAALTHEVLDKAWSVAHARLCQMSNQPFAPMRNALISAIVPLFADAEPLTPERLQELRDRHEREFVYTRDYDALVHALREARISNAAFMRDHEQDVTELLDLRAQLQRSEQARVTAEQERDYWQTCSNCGQKMDVPGDCSVAQREREAGRELMLDAAWDERDAANKRRDAAESRAARLREALRTFGQHGTGCTYGIMGDGTCGCGLSAALSLPEEP